jgi:hypothetical protein
MEHISKDREAIILFVDASQIVSNRSNFLPGNAEILSAVYAIYPYPKRGSKGFVCSPASSALLGLLLTPCRNSIAYS